MAVVVAMLRGVNVGGHNKIKMDALREICGSMKFSDAQTYVQSGNVVFRTEERDLGRVGKLLQDGIEKKFGFRPGVILRNAAELRSVIARNPFAERRVIEPNRLLVWFLATDPGAEVRKAIKQIKTETEELRPDGRELYIYFSSGMARPGFSWAVLERTLKTAGTGRNWNSVNKLLEMAEALEAAV
jgi:uncharacterized protein (DUF1697 family)